MHFIDIVFLGNGVRQRSFLSLDVVINQMQGGAQAWHQLVPLSAVMVLYMLVYQRMELCKSWNLFKPE